MDNPYEAQLTDPAAAPATESLITAKVYESLAGTKPWVRFLAVLGFIGSGLMMIAGVFMLLGGGMMMLASASGSGSELPTGAAMPFAGFPVLMAILYFVMGVVYLFPALKLWGYGSGIARMMASNAVGDLETALDQQRSFWKFVGIMTIAMFVLYGVVMVIVVMAAVAGATMVS